ncbi:MAG TPA: type II toxin-antitoxin system PemK/MazF family toxin [Terriglobales bacterium]|nr:type II toxin-antitoxin system PemK/MazF family toxin [Terriglobales bacterium]
MVVAYVFAGELGIKRRPGLILSTAAYHAGRSEAILAAITSNTGRLLYGDAPVTGWQQAGLALPSVLTAIIRTIKQAMVVERLGTLPTEELRAAERRWAGILALAPRAGPKR